jgi:hypothetical protein
MMKTKRFKWLLSGLMLLAIIASVAAATVSHLKPIPTVSIGGKSRLVVQAGALGAIDKNYHEGSHFSILAQSQPGWTGNSRVLITNVGMIFLLVTVFVTPQRRGVIRIKSSESEPHPVAPPHRRPASNEDISAVPARVSIA